MKTAVALCVHHKPWLAMSTILTALVQDEQAFDVRFLRNAGDGDAGRPSYARYRALRDDAHATNTHLSPYDEGVAAVCALALDRASDVEYVNDQTLDSGAFYKFIRDRRWTPYEHVLFAGEGTLFARPNTLSTMLRFARETPAHFIASGHEQRRLPKNTMLRYSSRHDAPAPMDTFHDEMVRETFAIFCRDPEFRALFDAWPSAPPGETRHYVPPIPPTTRAGRRVRAALVGRGAGMIAGASSRPPLQALFEMPYQLDAFCSRASIALGSEAAWPPAPLANGDTPADRVVVEGVAFHRVHEPEWFGCTPVLLLSRMLLERFAARLERFGMYDVLDLPFAATGLEVVWGFLPAWLGFTKWFTDGFHRVRKDFVTHRREDYPPDMASYINRYHRGRLSVAWAGEHLKVRAMKRDYHWLTDALPAVYF
ncbi:MAG: hypothetical protein ABUS56_10075 [Acidobacteriota bacterium]